jgi:hypothetical protein
MESVNIYTRTEMARQIGRTKQWVHDKVRRHVRMYPADQLFELTASDGRVMVCRLVKSGSNTLLKVEEVI